MVKYNIQQFHQEINNYWIRRLKSKVIDVEEAEPIPLITAHPEVPVEPVVDLLNPPEPPAVPPIAPANSVAIQQEQSGEPFIPPHRGFVV